MGYADRRRRARSPCFSVRWPVRWAAGLVTGLCLAAALGVAHAEPALAMITDCVGGATVVGAEGEKPCTILDYLGPGDGLKLALGDRVTLVYLQSSKEYSFQGASSVIITSQAPQVLDGAAPAVRELALARQTALAPSTNPGLAQAALVLRGAAEKKIRLLDPRDTMVLDPRPRFRWRPLDEGVQYRFALMDATGRAVIAALVNGTSFVLPAGIALHAGSSYSWQVDARTASGASYSSTADFTVLPKRQREEVERVRPQADASFSERVLFAAYLERMELHMAAQHYWKQLARERPGDRSLAARANR